MPRAMPLVLILATGLSSIVANGHAQQSDTAAPAPPEASQRATTMQISIKLGDQVITATLANNPTSRDFVSLLPLNLTLEDHAATEKISYLPRKLSTEGAPPGSDPAVGDIAYYAPWGNLAVFYKDFRYSSGLINLGKIDGGAEALNVPGRLTATVELVR